MAYAYPAIQGFSENGWIDHFLGSSLNSRWTAVTSGTGSVAVTDSYAEILAPVNSAAFIYKNTKLTPGQSGIFFVCLSLERLSGSGSADFTVALLNGATAPAADTSVNISAKVLATVGIGGGATPTQYHPWYFTPGGSQVFYDRINNLWSTTYPGNSNLAVVSVNYDDYFIVGVELDGVGNRWRMLFYNKSFATAGTWTFEQGLRLYAVSPWVLWTSGRSNSDIWLTIGQPANNLAGSWRMRVESVRYHEALPSNRILDGFIASKTSASSSHSFKHVYSLDGVVGLPQDAVSSALTLGGSPPDNVLMNDVRWAWDGASTDYLFYTGITNTPVAGTKSICVAKATHQFGEYGQVGAFTRSANNPILSLGASGAFDDQQIGFPFVFKDATDADANKRWKLFYGAQKASTGVRSIGYATAPDAEGPWTKQGAVYTFSSSYSAETAVWSFAMAYVNSTWEMWVEDHVAVTGESLIKRGTLSTDFLTLTLDGTTYFAPGTGGDQALTANLATAPGRVVTVADTTGFTVDATVILSQSLDSETWSASRIRKILSSTQLELYHGLTGFTTTFPARIKQISTSPNWSPRHLLRVGNEWRLYLGQWEPWLHSAENGVYYSLYEDIFLLRHSAATPAAGIFTIDEAINPVFSRQNYDGARSYENVSFMLPPFMGPSAALGGTGATMVKTDVVTGGKTITLTLTGDTFIPA